METVREQGDGGSDSGGGQSGGSGYHVRATGGRGAGGCGEKSARRRARMHGSYSCSGLLVDVTLVKSFLLLWVLVCSVQTKWRDLAISTTLSSLVLYA